MKINKKDRKVYLENKEEFFKLMDESLIEMGEFSPTQQLFALSDFRSGRLLLFALGQYFAGLKHPGTLATNIKEGYIPVQKWAQSAENFEYYQQAIIEGRLDLVSQARADLVQMILYEKKEDEISSSSKLN